VANNQQETSMSFSRAAATGGVPLYYAAWCACLLLLLSGCAEPETAQPPTSEPPLAAVPATPPRPNILLIVADDLGFTDLGAFGSEIPTPNLDRLAFGGLRLTSFHTGPACQETRAMLMSGRGSVSAIEQRPPRPAGERANALRPDIATLPELLRDAGYATYMSGKWDLGLTAESTPHARGFERSFALLEASSSHFAEPFWDETSYYQEDDQPVPALPGDFYSTTYYTDKLLEYLAAHDGVRPWFGYLAYTAPHWPLQVPEDWLDRHAGRYDAGYDALREARFTASKAAGVMPKGADLKTFKPVAAPWSTLPEEHQRRYARTQEIYAAMVELMDQQIGRVIDELADSGQLDNTFIVFMSDHGASATELGVAGISDHLPPHFARLMETRNNAYENFGRPGSFIDHGRGFGEAATAPLKHFKGTVSEGGIRAAAFAHYPPLIQRPKVDGTFMTVMDLLPTFLQLAGTRHPGNTVYNGREVQDIRGRSLVPYLSGRSVTVHGSENAAGWHARTVGAIIKGRYKLTDQYPPGTWIPPEERTWRLYDLVADPGETRDISKNFPDRVASLKAKWEQDWK
jgi:arylsulfatase